MFSFLFTPLIGLLVLSASARTTTDECQQAVQQIASQQHRIFRSTLFGEPTAEDAPIGHIITAEDNSNWIKVADSEWRSIAEGFKDTTWSDTLVDSQKITPTRKGIFEIKRTLTSELVPHITESLRTFDCRLRMLCKVVQLGTEGQTEPIDVSIVGCEERSLTPPDECQATNEEVTPSLGASGIFYCDQLVQELYNREVELVRMTVEYDAAYRSTLQLAGDLDGFMTQLRWPMTNTIQKVANIIGSVARVPCFTASCDDYPLPHENESSASSN